MRVSKIADKIMIRLGTADNLRMFAHRQDRKQVSSEDSPLSEQSSGQMSTEGTHQESPRIKLGNKKTRRVLLHYGRVQRG